MYLCPNHYTGTDCVGIDYLRDDQQLHILVEDYDYGGALYTPEDFFGFVRSLDIKNDLPCYVECRMLEGILKIDSIRTLGNCLSISDNYFRIVLHSETLSKLEDTLRGCSCDLCLYVNPRAHVPFVPPFQNKWWRNCLNADIFVGPAWEDGIFWATIILSIPSTELIKGNLLSSTIHGSRSMFENILSQYTAT